MWAVIVALAVLAAASVYDLRERRIPPVLSYFLLFFGLSFHAAQSLASRNPDVLLEVVLVTGAAFTFAYLLYRVGFWAGGDTKLFTGLAATVPTYGGFAFFPFWAFAAAALLALPVLAAWLGAVVVFSPKLRREASAEFRKSVKTAFTYGVFLFMLFYFVSGFSLRLADFAASLAAFLIISCIYAAGFTGLRVARKHVLRSRVPVSELRPGMMLAQAVKAQGVSIPLRARGVSPEEVSLLRKKRVGAVLLAKSLPFTPMLALAVFILFLVGLVK